MKWKLHTVNKQNTTAHPLHSEQATNESEMAHYILQLQYWYNLCYPMNGEHGHYKSNKKKLITKDNSLMKWINVVLNT